MKKILNRPADYVDEMLDGLVAAHPEHYRLYGDSHRVIARATPGRAGKVGIVSGGGSGHLPIFTGYVGAGLLDACAIGDVFASPSAEQMADAIRAAHQGAGVLRLYGNYGGDVMNFDMAGDLVEFEDIATTTVLLADDVASAGPEEREKRRGVAGMVYAFKIAGAAAEAGRDLGEVTRIAQKAADACRSVGRGAVALHGAAGRAADLRDRRGRDGDGHGHPRRARGLARQAAARRRHRRRADGPAAGRPAGRRRATGCRCWSTASGRRRPRSSTSSTGW